MIYLDPVFKIPPGQAPYFKYSCKSEKQETGRRCRLLQPY